MQRLFVAQRRFVCSIDLATNLLQILICSHNTNLQLYISCIIPLQKTGFSYNSAKVFLYKFEKASKIVLGTIFGYFGHFFNN
jgi:hypothetical protein